jgi:hypothetical protein
LTSFYIFKLIGERFGTTLRFKVLEDEGKGEGEGEDDLWINARKDTTFVRPAHITEALRDEDAPAEASAVAR